MEAETNVGCTTAQCVMWCRNFLEEMGFKQTTPTILYEDNSSCITVNSSWKAHPGSRHYELKQFFLREKVVDTKEIAMKKISNNSQIADLFTKQLPHVPFARHRHSLGIQLPTLGKGSVEFTSIRSAYLLSGGLQGYNGEVYPLVCDLWRSNDYDAWARASRPSHESPMVWARQ
jgi:hypothetical protein